MGDVNRRLAGILAADVVGYSALMGVDEPATLMRVRTLRIDVIEPTVAIFGGRVFKITGDGFLAAFASAVQALRCALAIQERLRDEADGLRFRIGVHQGEVVAEGDDLFGDGVIIVARLEPLAEPGGICISSRVREDAAGKIAMEVDDLGTPNLKNIAAKIRVFRVHTGAESHPVPPLPEKPSVAVLPFKNMSEDPEQEYFADGIVEEIITALSRIKWLFVIARNSSFVYKGRTADMKRIGHELGVRYLLEGSVRKASSRLRITVQLIEAETRAHLWADRFDGSFEDVFDLQDKVAVSVAGVIGPTMQAAEIRRSSERPTTDLSAYDLYLRALPYVATYEWDPVIKALGLLSRAIERDPGFASALARAAYCHAVLDAIGKVVDREENRRISIDLARQALRAAGDDAMALAGVAHVLGYFNEDVGTAIAIVDRSLALDPSSAYGWRWSGFLRLYAGKPDLAIVHFQRSIRLNPRDLHWAQLTGIGIAHFFLGRIDESEEMLLSALQQNPAYPLANRFLASCYAHVGRLDEARAVVARLRAITPNVIPETTNYRDRTHNDLFLSGLRMAASQRERGLPN